MKTRKDYMEKRVTHREYYAQFVNQNIKSRVLAAFTLDEPEGDTMTPKPTLVVGSVDTLAATILHQDEGEPGSNRRFEHWKERAALHDYADQRAVLDCKPLRGLRAVHECAGLYVIVRECPHAPDNYEVIAENLTAEHARQICEAVNSAAK